MSDQPRFALDTSAAVPLLLPVHGAHAMVSAWARGRSLSLSGHAVAETYSVLTRLPGDSRVSPSDAAALIDDNFPEECALPPSIAAAVHRALSALGVSGGATYDGLVALAARENARILVTRDARARATYEAVGARVEVLVASGAPDA